MITQASDELGGGGVHFNDNWDMLFSVSEPTVLTSVDVLADAAVDEALEVVARGADDGELGLSTEVTTLEVARSCLNRINDALRMDEWLDEVEVWVWDAHTSVRRPITPGGETHGVELRIEPRVS